MTLIELLTGAMPDPTTDRLMTKDSLVAYLEDMAHQFRVAPESDGGKIFLVDTEFNGRGPTLTIRGYQSVIDNYADARKRTLQESAPSPEDIAKAFGGGNDSGL